MIQDAKIERIRVESMGCVQVTGAMLSCAPDLCARRSRGSLQRRTSRNAHCQAVLRVIRRCSLATLAKCITCEGQREAHQVVTFGLLPMRLVAGFRNTLHRRSLMSTLAQPASDISVAEIGRARCDIGVRYTRYEQISGKDPKKNIPDRKIEGAHDHGWTNSLLVIS